MPTPVRYLVVLLVAIGLGALTWGIGGLMEWNTPLIQNGWTTYMDARGAIGIGVGALAGAGTAILVFRDGASARDFGKRSKEPYDLS
jgi:hypothetical protein